MRSDRSAETLNMRHTCLRVGVYAWLLLVYPGMIYADGESDPVVIELGETAVTRGELNDRFQVALALLARQQGISLAEQNPGVVERLRQQYLEKHASELVLLKEAARRNVTVESAEVDAALAEILGEGGENEFVRPITARGVDAERLLLQIVRDDLTIQRLTEAMLAEIVVPAGDVFTLHHDIKEELATPATVCVRHIQSDTAESARAVRARLDEGADFVTLAAERSTDKASADSGGDLGCFEKGRSIVRSEFEEAAFAARTGDTVGPVKSERGYHVIYVYKHTPYHLPTLNEAYAELEQELRHEQLPKRINALMSDSGIRTYPQNFVAAAADDSDD